MNWLKRYFRFSKSLFSITIVILSLMVVIFIGKYLYYEVLHLGPKPICYKYCYYLYNDSVYNAYSVEDFNDYQNLLMYNDYKVKGIKSDEVYPINNIKKIDIMDKVEVYEFENDSVALIKHREIFNSDFTGAEIMAYVPKYLLFDTIPDLRIIKMNK